MTELPLTDPPESVVNELVSLMQYCVDEFSSLRVQFRNVLNVGHAKRLMAQIEQLNAELADYRTRDLIPREVHLSQLQAVQQQKNDVVDALTAQIAALEQELQGDTDEYVQTLIRNLEQAQHTLEQLRQQVETLSQPQTFSPATRDDHRMGNVVIAYFAQLGLVLDRAYSDYRKWEATLYFHVDRNRKTVVASDLNEHGDRLQPLLQCLNTPQFRYDSEQGLMALRVQMAHKPKADGSEIHKLWKRADQFEAIACRWERLRITGGSETGKSPTAENIAVCILKARPGSRARLANPMHDSKKTTGPSPSSGDLTLRR